MSKHYLLTIKHERPPGLTTLDNVVRIDNLKIFRVHANRDKTVLVLRVWGRREGRLTTFLVSRSAVSSGASGACGVGVSSDSSSKDKGSTKKELTSDISS